MKYKSYGKHIVNIGGVAFPMGDPQPYIAPEKISRNSKCPCGSGKKYKHCCSSQVIKSE